MSTNARIHATLTSEQARLVGDNLGLVAVHLRKHIPNLSRPRREREWDDLFQEGCLGLIQAALRYDAQRGIPFAAFALPRIHLAVSRALQRRFTMINVPLRRKEGANGNGSQVSLEQEESTLHEIPKMHALSDDLLRRLADPGEEGASGADTETIGQRLREKYERAVRDAGAILAAQNSTRGDRDLLTSILIEERFLVPHEESRRAMRQIARDTRSSYARVAQCDQQLANAIREILERDPEFVELRRLAADDPRGCETAIDEKVEMRLAVAATEEIMRRYRAADLARRGLVLFSVLEESALDIESLMRGSLSLVTPEIRGKLLNETVDPAPRTNKVHGRNRRRNPRKQSNSGVP